MNSETPLICYCELLLREITTLNIKLRLPVIKITKNINCPEHRVVVVANK